MSFLVRHPDTPPGAIQAIDAELARVPGGAVATFRMVGDIARLCLPPPVAPERTDGLWRTTCFELFVGSDGDSYREYNFSPSGAWAAYEFDDYRAGMRGLPAAISIQNSSDDKNFTMIAKIESEFPESARIGLSAVVEEADRIIRYWATAFAPGKPDFHAEAVRCLILDGVSAE
jgi:hypothetical protein